MPADFQVSVAFNDPMVPLESPESCIRMSLRVTSAVIPLASWTLSPAVETEILV